MVVFLEGSEAKPKFSIDNNLHQNAMDELKLKINLEFLESMNKELEKEYAEGI